jgi:hypothetical protein
MFDYFKKGHLPCCPKASPFRGLAYETLLGDSLGPAPIIKITVHILVEMSIGELLRRSKLTCGDLAKNLRIIHLLVKVEVIKEVKTYREWCRSRVLIPWILLAYAISLRCM